jgi:hypothetical protein
MVPSPLKYGIIPSSNKGARTNGIVKARPDDPRPALGVEDSTQKWQEYLVKQREAEQQEKAAADRVAELPNTALDNMYWSYEIKGGDASTRPMHVMDDGAKTYIQMPIETIHRELPVLVVKRPNGSEMVNYRVKDNMYIEPVDATNGITFGSGSAS